MRIEIFGGEYHTRPLIYLDFDEALLPEVLNIETVAEALGVDPEDLRSAAKAKGWEEALDWDFGEEDPKPLDELNDGKPLPF